MSPAPAAQAGLSEQDEIVAIDDVRVVGGAGAAEGGGQTIDALLKDKKPGDKIKLAISRRGTIREFEVVLARKPARSFAITPMPNLTPVQAAILKDWLGE